MPLLAKLLATDAIFVDGQSLSSGVYPSSGSSSDGQFQIHGPTDHPAKVNYRKQKTMNMGKEHLGRWKDGRRRREIKMGVD